MTSVPAGTAAEEFSEVHLSFAVGELGLRMDEFFDMPWCEYLLKCYAWQRMDREKWRHTRQIAFEAKVGSHLDPKKLPRSMEEYIPLRVKKSSAAMDGRKKAIKEELQRIKEERERIKNKKI